MTLSGHLLISLLLAAAASPVGAVLPDLWVRASEDCWWVGISEVDPINNQRVLRLAYSDDKGKARTPRGLRPIVGGAARAAVKDDELFIFFDDGTHRRFSPKGAFFDRKLPGGAVPKVMFADGKRDVLYAVVEKFVGQEIIRVRREEDRARIEKEQRRSGVVVGSPASRPAPEPAVELGNSRYCLAGLSQGKWHVLAPLPEWFDDFTRCQAAAYDGQYFLFFESAHAPGQWHYAHAEPDGWHGPVAVDEAEEAADAWCALVDKVPYFVMATPVSAGDDQVRLAVMLWQGDTFDRHPALTLDGQELRLPLAQVGVAGYAKQLAVVYEQQPADPQLNLWAVTGGEPRGHPVSIAQAFAEPPWWQQTKVRNIVQFVLLAAILFMILVWRQDSFVSPAKLPAHLVPASHSRRLAAFALDFFVPAMVAFIIWAGEWVEYFNALPPATKTQAPVLIPLGCTLSLFAAAGFYSLYCLIAELTFRTTIGKRVVGLRVVAEGGGECGAWQIFIRNTFRFVETSYPLGLFPTLVMAALTRNHQRLGDIAARTVVVETAPVASQAPPDQPFEQ